MRKIVALTVAMAVAAPVTAGLAYRAAAEPLAHRGHRIILVGRVRRPASVAPRGLTITRPPDADRNDDIGDADGTERFRYNSIRTFNPNPYTDSGVQFPFGLDGIGGYGSDLGFETAQDWNLYRRGP